MKIVCLLLIVFITELFKYGIWFRGMYSLKIKRTWVGAAAIIGFAASILLGAVDENTLLLLWCAVSIIVYILILDCDKGEKALNIFRAGFLIICMGEIVGGVTSPFSARQDISRAEEKIIYLINNSIVIALISIAAVIKRKLKLPDNEKWKKGYRFIIYVSVFVMGMAIFLTIAGFQAIARYTPNEKIILFSKVISIISFVSVACLIMIMIYIDNENKKIKKYRETDALLLETQRNLYNAMLAKNEETRRFRHDMQGHLICLNGLAHSGDISKVMDYVAGMEGQLLEIKNITYSVGNDIIDAILNYYISLLDKEVKVDVNGRCPANMKINAVELCTIVSNPIQNAVEALNKTECCNRYLKINITNNNNYMKFEVINSMPESDKKVMLINGLLTTTKADKENHGIGIRNVKETVEKNRGDFRINVGNGEFVVKVTMPYDECLLPETKIVNGINH
ncbi:GHKL domain-containing protein [Kineothrix alysoides]|uniref:GHKL domain-containing protein n=1 Tax=Kineothrix alysoides TaxID=1469948 RepID=A0A4R1R002_9FIRM|nr:GHKL domain-containing protein [Kineothrix alysoides]TCL58588.1 GHKL domain-containing protein [Kineothrix alysoides]